MTMKRTLLAALMASTALLAACGDKKGAAPTGQVVATVDGEDVTIHELNAEIQSLGAPAGTARKDLERAALDRIVNRRLLANAAREQKVDATPQFAMVQRRAEETLLVQALTSQMASKVPQTTRTDAEKFIEANPNTFAERKFLVVDQITFAPPPGMEQLNLGNARTLDQVEQVLAANNIEYRRAPSTIDALAVDPKFITEVMNVLQRNPNELFMFPDPRAGGRPIMLVNRVTEVRTIPFTGDRAVRYAQNLLQNEKVNRTLQQQVTNIQKGGKEKVVYAAGYGPPAAATPGAAKGAPAATPPAAPKAG